MREIKFRAWDERTQKFYYSGLTCLLNKNGYLFEGEGSAHADFFDWYGDNTEIDIEQYTGLKDKNGKEIYEGDVINIIYKNFSYKNREIYFNKEYCGFRFRNNAEELRLKDCCLYEIIGNIHETK